MLNTPKKKGTKPTGAVVALKTGVIVGPGGKHGFMPEGHIVHGLARDQAHLVGRSVAASSPQGRFRHGAAAIDGRTLSAVDAIGKHLVHRYETQHLHVHLGMSGKFVPIVARVARPGPGYGYDSTSVTRRGTCSPRCAASFFPIPSFGR